MTRIAVIPALDPTSYKRSPLHSDDQLWVEKNCYIDIWIELLHALQLEPRAMLGFTLAVDFEGDQWTFFKPRHEELRELYGVDVQELTVWRPLLDHAVEHLGAGKFISTESDSFWLPDTAGTDYRRQHVKTTIVLTEIDVERQRLGYFHSAGLHWLEGEDFAQIFGLGQVPDPQFLPLFAEFVRIDRVTRRDEGQLASIALRLLRQTVAQLPAYNPIEKFRTRFEQDVPGLLEAGLPNYHAWAFGTLRQLGAACELAAQHLQWLAPHAGIDLSADSQALTAVASANKSLVLKTARAVNARRRPEFGPVFDEMAAQLNKVRRNLQRSFPTDG